MKNRQWTYVSVPVDLAKKIDNTIEHDKYPHGKWHSRGHYAVEALTFATENNDFFKAVLENKETFRRIKEAFFQQLGNRKP